MRVHHSERYESTRAQEESHGLSVLYGFIRPRMHTYREWTQQTNIHKLRPTTRNGGKHSTN